jgi:hypothetical protein
MSNAEAAEIAEVDRHVLNAIRGASPAQRQWAWTSP